MSDTKGKILFVEDDPSLGFLVKDNLLEAGYDVVHTTDGESGYKEFMRSNFDICLFDVMLPKKDGLTIANMVRKKNEKIPIILLTAKSADEDKIAGFKSGVDDYITKPFNMEELLLRIEVHLKRTKKDDTEEPQIFEMGALTFDSGNLLLKGPSGDHQLTQKESDLLKYLALNANKILKREEILLNVWGKEDYFLGRSMDVFVTKLRKYLKDEPKVELQTIHGIGFKFII